MNLVLEARSVRIVQLGLTALLPLYGFFVGVAIAGASRDARWALAGVQAIVVACLLAMFAVLQRVLSHIERKRRDAELREFAGRKA